MPGEIAVPVQAQKSARFPGEIEACPELSQCGFRRPAIGADAWSRGYAARSNLMDVDNAPGTDQKLRVWQWICAGIDPVDFIKELQGAP